MDEFDLEIKKEFINEALGNLEEAEGAFMELEGSADPKPLLDRIFRLAHNLKGGSRAVGFGEVAEFTHQLENLVQKLQKNEVALSPDVVTTLLRANDLLVEMLATLKTDINAKFDTSELLKDIEKWISGEQVSAPQKVSTEPAQTKPDVHPQSPLVHEIAQPVLIEATESPPEVPSADAFFADETPITNLTLVKSEPEIEAKLDKPTLVSTKDKPKENAVADDEVVRVNLSKIDSLNDLVGELIVLQSMIQQQVAKTNSVQLHASVRQVAKLSKDIQGISMGLRMLPVKPLIQKLQRVVRDTAKALDKEVQLEVEGEHMEVDKSVLDRLSDPLIHILRNAVDHGLETRDQRRSANKSEKGIVRLTFMNEGNHLTVLVSDDGKGINAQVLRQKAIEKGLITEGQSLTEKQVIHLIFHPGFSTKASASEISGRGVGMDVVKTNVEKIGGVVDIQTEVGSGSTFKLQIPLSLAVIEGLVVASNQSRYVIPLSQVQETVNLKNQKIHTNKLGIGSCFELRGHVVPIFAIDSLLGSRISAVENGTALIVQVEDRPLAVMVDEIIQSQQIVVKPVGNGITQQRGWVGTCVLGDGLPTLILSPVDLLKGKVEARLEKNQDAEVA